MPTRYLKPGIRDSERINALSAQAEVLFYRLLVSVDDFGRFDARPSMVRSTCFPVRDELTSDEVSDWLSELANAGLILVYKADGKPYLQMCKWDSQPRAKESKFPPPSSDTDKSPTDVCKPHTDVCKPSSLLPVTETGTDNRNREPITETSVANATGAKAPDPAETIFGYGIPMLVSAGTPEKQARSFLGKLRKDHGDAAVVDALRACYRDKPLQPVEFLGGILRPNGAGPPDHLNPRFNKRLAAELRIKATADEWLRRTGAEVIDAKQ